MGVAGFVPLLLALVLPLPLSNCEQKGLGGGVVEVDEQVAPPGKITELGTNCSGFSMETPKAHQLVG